MGLYIAWEFVLMNSAPTVKDEFDGELHAQRGVAGSPGKSLSSKDSVCAYHLCRRPLKKVLIGSAESVKFMSVSVR